MATYTKTVDPNGGADYTSLSAWEAGEQTSYSSGDIAVADCRRTGGTRDTTLFSISGWSVGVTPKIIVNEAHRHEGKFADQRVADGNYIYTYAPTTPSIGISITANATEIHWLQIEHLGSGTTNNYDISLENNSNHRIYNCVFKCSNNTGTSIFGAIYVPTTVSINYNYIINCVFSGYTRASGNYIAGVHVTSNAAYVFASNNTFYNCDYGFYTSYTRTWLENNVVLNCRASCYYNTFASGSNNNVSSDATAPGTTVATGKTAYTSYFVDPANHDLHLKDTGYNLFGINGMNPPTVPSSWGDIDGQTRTVFDVGADEYTISAVIADVGAQQLTLVNRPVTVSASGLVTVGLQQLTLVNRPVSILASSTVITGSPQQLTLVNRPVNVIVSAAGVAVVGPQQLTLVNLPVTISMGLVTPVFLELVARARYWNLEAKPLVYTLVASDKAFSLVASKRSFTLINK